MFTSLCQIILKITALVCNKHQDVLTAQRVAATAVLVRTGYGATEETPGPAARSNRRQRLGSR